MTTPGYVLKLIRARQQLYEIATRHAAFVNSELNFTTSQISDAGKPWVLMTWGSEMVPPPVWGVYLGEMVHNMRSALDQLMWELVGANNEHPGKHTQFPLCETEGKWRDDITDRAPERGDAPTEGVSEVVLRAIKYLQPHSLTHKQRARHPLVVLHRMSNVDKHRTLHVSAVSAGRPDKVELLPRGIVKIVKKRFEPGGRPVHKGAEIGRLQIAWVGNPPSTPTVDVQIRITGAARLDFGEPGEALGVHIRDLRMMLRWCISATRFLRDVGLRHPPDAKVRLIL